MRACDDGRVRREDEGDEPRLVEEAEDAEHRQRRREDVDAARGRNRWTGRRTRCRRRPRGASTPKTSRCRIGRAEGAP